MFRIYRIELVALGILGLVLSATLVQAISTTRTLEQQAATYNAHTTWLNTAVTTKRTARASAVTQLYGTALSNTPRQVPHFFTIPETARTPYVTARAYLIGDVTTGTIYAAKQAETPRPIASISKLATALTANALIAPADTISVVRDAALTQSDYRRLYAGTAIAGSDTIYPLLMESNNAVAHALAHHVGEADFFEAMHYQALNAGMQSAHFADASGISRSNVASPRDLFALARYLYNATPFILEATLPERYTLNTNQGTYTLKNRNHFTPEDGFVGGKTGYTATAGQTMLALFDVTIDDSPTTIAIVVLNSKRREADVVALRNWFVRNAQPEALENAVIVSEERTRIVGTTTPTTTSAQQSPDK